MITATCKNSACSQFEAQYNFLGEPQEVECGLCSNFCKLSDSRPDPTEEQNETPSPD
jgi:hypothetical protein